MTKRHVFVYGTLKRNERNHAYLVQAHFAGATQTADDQYVMMAFHSRTSPGRFSPGVLRAAALDHPFGFIEGEVFEVSDTQLQALDRLENVGTSYDRDSVILQDGRSAFIYIKRHGAEGILPSPHISLNKDKIYRWREYNLGHS